MGMGMANSVGETLHQGGLTLDPERFWHGVVTKLLKPLQNGGD
jgi:hypothetical protein